MALRSAGIEIQGKEESNEIIAAGADVVMPDNLEDSELAPVVNRMRAHQIGARNLKTFFFIKTSGGITENNSHWRSIAGEWTHPVPHSTDETSSCE